MPAKNRNMSDANILKKYYDITFPGSYSGIRVFKKALKSELNLDVSYKRVRNILKSSQTYQTSFFKRKKFPRRRILCSGSFIEAEADVGSIVFKKKLKHFLCIVDIFSKKLYCTSLKSTKISATKSALLKLFPKNTKIPFSVLRTDLGGNFLGIHQFCI